VSGYFVDRHGKFRDATKIAGKDIVGYCVDFSDGIARIASINTSADIRTDPNGMAVANSDVYQSSIDGEIVNTNQTVALSDFSGMEVTAIYKSLPNLDKYPDFAYCAGFAPGLKNGEWYMPALGELILFINSYDQIRQPLVSNGIDTNLINAGKVTPSWDTMREWRLQIFSTTRRDSVNNWCYYFNGNTVGNGGRPGAAVGLPYLNYCCTVPFLQITV
jgi:hypothetical protein